MKVWVVIDVGCQECGVSSEGVGIFKSEAEAKAAADQRDKETGCWRDGGQTFCETGGVVRAPEGAQPHRVEPSHQGHPRTLHRGLEVAMATQHGEQNTRYFTFRGQFLVEDERGEDVPMVGDELQAVIGHMLMALNVYAKDGFRFVDVDGGGTLSDGRFALRWSDYGLED